MAELQTVWKATQILDLFSPEHYEWGVSEVARALGLPKSTTCELMSSLTNQRLLCRTSEGRYRLGWRLFELSQTLLETTEFRVEARRVMEELVAGWNEITHLAVLDGAQAVYVEKLQPAPAVKIPVSWPGARLPAHCSGVGKVLLAYSEWERVAEMLKNQGMPAFTPNTITDLEELNEELERIREQGHAYDIEEISIGLCCVAAPIYSREDEVIAAISLSVPAFRFDPSIEEYTAAAVEAAQRISTGIGYKAREYSRHRMEEQRR